MMRQSMLVLQSTRGICVQLKPIEREKEREVTVTLYKKCVCTLMKFRSCL